MVVFKASPHPAMAHESPVLTPLCPTARPGSSLSVLSNTSAIPSLDSSSDSDSITSLEPTVPAGNFFYTSSQQLNPNGYPTRALYYLHKRMLEVALYPGLYHNQPWGLQIRPGTPIPSSPLGENEGIIAPDNSLEEEDILRALGGVKQVCSMEEDLVLHNLCATLVSTEYVAPPTPPTGATPCDTPPEFEPPTFTTHDEHACRMARMLVSSGVTELDGRTVEELEVELECGGAWAMDGCPCGRGENKKSLLEEMQMCASKTPRETRQARRRARNSLRGIIQEVTVEVF